ncbi:MAG: YegP family protein [Phycisphaerales bacterium]
MAFFTLSRSDNGSWWFRLIARDGGLLLSSEPFASRELALQGIDEVRIRSVVDAGFLRHHTAVMQHSFTLCSASQGVIGRSPIYASAPEMETAIEHIKQRAHSATVRDANNGEGSH